MPHLEVLDADGRPVGTHDLAGERTVVGRDLDVDVRLEDPRVSRRHAAVLFTERGVLAVALGDNLLRRKGTRCTHLFVDDGVPFRLGDTKLRLVGASPAVAPTLLDEPTLDEPSQVAIDAQARAPSAPMVPQAPPPDAAGHHAGIEPPAVQQAPPPAGTDPCPACNAPTFPADAYCGHCGEPLRRAVLGPMVAVIAVVLLAAGIGHGLGWW